MYIITKNKKKIFTNKNKDKIVESILVDIENKVDEQGGLDKFFVYDIFVEVDKRQMLVKDIKNIKVELSKVPLHKLNIRENMLKGVDASKAKEVHFAVTNARDLRIKSLLGESVKKEKPIKNAGKISSIDIFKKSKVSKAKRFNLSDNQVFGTKKVLKLRRTRRENKKFDASSDRNIFSFDKKKNRRKKQRKIHNPSLILRKKTKKLSRSGIDTASILSSILKQDQSQTTLQSLRGRVDGISKANKSPFAKLLKRSIQTKTNLGILSKNRNESNVLSMQYEIIPTRNEVVKQRIKISQKDISQLKSQRLYLIFTAIDAKGTKIDVSEGIIKHESQKINFAFPTFDFKVSSNRGLSNKIILKIANNEDRERFYNVYAKKITEFMPAELIKYQRIGSGIKVPARSSVTIKRKGILLSRYPVYFRVNPVYDNLEYSNSEFSFVNSKGRIGQENYAGMSVTVSDDRMVIDVRNVPEDTFRVQAVKRNLTKNETSFKPLLTKDQSGIIKENNGKVGNAENSKYRFIDDDVELNHVYEYKTRLTSKEGIIRESSTSFIEKYVKRSGFLNVNASAALNKRRSKNNKLFYTLDVQIERNITDADRVFQDLFGRFYDLFEDDLKEVKDLNAIIINFNVSLINLDTSEEINVGNFGVDRDGNASVDILTDAAFDYRVKITPRALPAAEIISKISNNIPFLAKKARFLPVSSFNTAAIKKVTRNRARGVASSVGTKYSDQSNRLRGKIIDKKTKLNQTDFDSFYDGNTGDLRYVSIGSNDASQTEVVSSLSIKRQRVKRVISFKNQKANNGLIKYKEINFLASFSLSDADLSIDYLIMSYSINEGVIVDGLASNNSDNTEKIINYVYSIKEPVGEVSFYCQAVFKNGTSSGVVEIESIVVDSNGDIVNV